jgi:hypothetical protein
VDPAAIAEKFRGVVEAGDTSSFAAKPAVSVESGSVIVSVEIGARDVGHADAMVRRLEPHLEDPEVASAFLGVVVLSTPSLGVHVEQLAGDGVDNLSAWERNSPLFAALIAVGVALLVVGAVCFVWKRRARLKTMLVVPTTPAPILPYQPSSAHPLPEADAEAGAAAVAEAEAAAAADAEAKRVNQALVADLQAAAEERRKANDALLAQLTLNVAKARPVENAGGDLVLRPR